MKGIVINDLHFGIKDSKRLYDELHQVTDYIKNNKDLELLVIAGDYFDKKLSVVDSPTYFAIQFFRELMNICDQNKIIVRMIQGTRSHDLNQLQIFKPEENEKLHYDFKIIETAQEENINGFNVLYLPEEYPENHKDYYAPFKDEGKEYNAIFGHGTWDFVALPGQIEKSDIPGVAPVFIYKEWKNTVKNGFISFGHIHGRNTYGKKIFYSGSFTRWGYGERGPRGFTSFYYDLENKSYDVNYIDNIEAPSFDVLEVKTLEIEDVEKLKEILDIEIKKSDNLKLDLTGLKPEMVTIIKEIYSNQQNIKIEVKQDKKELLKLNEESDEQKKKFEKYHYITKRQLPLNETVKKYCKEDLNSDISIDVINKILEKE